MHPYRNPPRADEDTDLGPPAEEIVLAGALVAIGGLRVGLALVAGGSFGVEPTIAAILFVAGIAIFVRRWWHG